MEKDTVEMVKWLITKVAIFAGGVAIGVMLFLVARLIWPEQLSWPSNKPDEVRLEAKITEPDESLEIPPVSSQFLEVDTDEVNSRSDSVFVQKRGKFYTLDKIDSSLSDKYGVGVRIPGSNYASLYHYGADSRVLSVGNFSTMTVNARDDELAKAGGGELTLRPVDFVGWSLPIAAQTTAPRIAILAAEQTAVLDGGVEVYDEDGYRWVNYNDLPRGRTYTVSWTKDGAKHEVQMIPNCRCYKISFDADRAIHLASEQVRDDNIASYDLSSVPVGTYLVYGAYPIGIVRIE